MKPIVVTRVHYSIPELQAFPTPPEVVAQYPNHKVLWYFIKFKCGETETIYRTLAVNIYKAAAQIRRECNLSKNCRIVGTHFEPVCVAK